MGWGRSDWIQIELGRRVGGGDVHGFMMIWSSSDCIFSGEMGFSLPAMLAHGAGLMNVSGAGDLLQEGWGVWSRVAPGRGRGW